MVRIHLAFPAPFCRRLNREIDETRTKLARTQDEVVKSMDKKEYLESTRYRLLLACLDNVNSALKTIYHRLNNAGGTHMKTSDFSGLNVQAHGSQTGGPPDKHQHVVRREYKRMVVLSDSVSESSFWCPSCDSFNEMSSSLPLKLIWRDKRPTL